MAGRAPTRRGLTAAVHDFLVQRGEPATIAEIVTGIAETYPNPLAPSVRAALQNERYFERVRRGVFKAKP